MDLTAAYPLADAIMARRAERADVTPDALIASYVAYLREHHADRLEPSPD